MGAPDKEPSTLSKICRGEASFRVNLLCSPIVLTANAIWIYILPCFAVILNRIYRLICAPVMGLCDCWVFTDTTFEGDAAIGTGDRVEWVRAAQLAKTKDGKLQKMKIYEGKIEPKDLCQGAVGNCWLVAALASASEHPVCIRRAFLTREATSSGKYRVRIYDGQRKQWVVVTIDDRIPCEPGTTVPLFMKANGNEMWAMLIEKAFAKFCGSYQALDGGLAEWAWKALTGDNVFTLKAEDGGARWRRLNFKNDTDKKGDKRDCSMWLTDEQYTPEQAWVLINKYVHAQALVSASGGKDMGGGGGGKNSNGLNGEALDDNGLVGTHAYSVLDVRELGLIPGLNLGSGLLGKTKLIRLRNPWGKFEWKGAWSDGSKEWRENPLVRLRLRPKDEDDGSFWMPWEDFSRIFKRVGVCDRTTSSDLRLEVLEDYGACGVVLGCVAGLANYVLTCKGARTIYAGHRSTDETKSAKRGCCGGIGGGPDAAEEVV